MLSSLPLIGGLNIHIKPVNEYLSPSNLVLAGFRGIGARYVIFRHEKTPMWPAFDVHVKLDVENSRLTFVEIDTDAYMDKEALATFKDMPENNMFKIQDKMYRKASNDEVREWVRGKEFEINL